MAVIGMNLNCNLGKRLAMESGQECNFSIATGMISQSLIIGNVTAIVAHSLLNF